MRDPQWCLKQAESIGPDCHRFMQRLLGNRVLERLRAAQGVVGLAKRYGAVRLEAACRRALHFDNIQYRAVRVILEKSLDQQADPRRCFDEMSDAYTGAARFGRDTRKLFTKH
jgi:hypothetical protein